MKKMLGLLIVLMMACVGCQSQLPPSAAPVPDQPMPAAAPGISAPVAPAAMPIPEEGIMVMDKDFNPYGVPMALDKGLENSFEKWCDPASFEFGDFYCQGGKLQLVAKGIGNVATNQDGDFKNFILQAQMRLIGAKGAYGLAFRGNDTPAFYVFEIHPDGHFQLIQWSQAKEAIALIPWTASAAIHPGGNTNLLEVKAEGARLTLFANSTQLASVSDDTFKEGGAGPIALEEGHAAVATMKVWKLP